MALRVAVARAPGAGYLDGRRTAALSTNGTPRRSASRARWTDRGLAVGGAALVVVGIGVVLAAVLLTPRSPGPVAATASPSPTSPAATTSAAEPTLTPTPPPIATPTPAPTPRNVAATGIDLTWRAVAGLPGNNPDPASQTVLATGLSRGPGGYLAVGEIVDGFLSETGATGPVHPALWTSADGIAWKPADPSGLGSAIPSTAAWDGKRLLLVATTASSSVVLRSTDLRAWTPVTPPGSRVTRIVAGGPGFIALGERTATGRAAIWTTSDGGSWRLAWESEVASGEELNALAVAPSGQAIAGGLQLGESGGARAAAVASPDGVAWRRVPAADLPASMSLDAIGVGADGAWYGSGFDDVAGAIGAWRSNDGTHWRPTTLSPGQLTELPGDTGSARLVFGYDSATFVMAYTSCCGDPPQRTLVSRDGTTWMRADRSLAIREVRMSAVLVEATRVLAIGGLNRGAGVWAATPAPTNGVELPTELAPRTAAEVCTTGVPQVTVRLTVDRTGAVARIRLERVDQEAEFGPIVWPYGWTAAPGPPLVLRARSGTVVAHEGDQLVLADGAVIGGSYHLCRLDGQAVTTR